MNFLTRRDALINRKFRREERNRHSPDAVFSFRGGEGCGGKDTNHAAGKIQMIAGQ